MNDNQQYNPDCTLPDVCIHFDRREHEKDRHLQAEHGITLADYRKMQEEQGFECGICDSPKEDLEMRVDSYNLTVRGLLCTDCIGRLNGMRALEAQGLFSKAKEWDNGRFGGRG